MKLPPPRPEEEGIPVLLRIPGMLDALLFWSLFASTSVLTLWLLTSTINNILREATLSDIAGQTALTAEAVSLHEIALRGQDGPQEEHRKLLEERLRSIVGRNPELLGAAVFVRIPGSGWEPLATAGLDFQGTPSGGVQRALALLDPAGQTGQTQFSEWKFLQKRKFTRFGQDVLEAEFAAQRLSLPGGPEEVLLLVFDAEAIQERFSRVDWTAAMVISLAILIATALSLLVRLRSMQREVAERQREEALELLGRRDAILACVAASADDMFRAKDPEPACAELMAAIRGILGLQTAAACLIGPTRPFSTEPAPLRLLIDPPGPAPLTPRDLDRPALLPWRERLLASQAIHGPLDLLPPAERLEIVDMGIANFAVLPVLADNHLAGLLVLTHANKALPWDPGLLDTLRLAADLIGASFSRRDQEERLMETGKTQALGRMAGGVAHEFNNLLHIISSNLRRVDNPALPPEQRADLVDKMIETTERGGRIVEQLLSATRQATPALRPAQLNEVIQKTIYLARPALRKDITLGLELDPALPTAAMDPAQIQQVILNLLINANDAIPGPGAITLRTGTTRGTDGKPYIYASVADTGTGIDPRDQEHLFDPFFTTKPPGKGTGLGLSTSRGILELHQGSITATNLEPSGAMFTFYLPLTTNKTGTQRIQLPPSDRIPVKAGRVLVADDEPLCVDVLRDTLLDQGFDCLTAASGDEALALAQEHGSTIQWVITDWTMPGSHGRELVRRLRALLPNAGIIVCSGFILEDEEIPEIDGLVVKPFNPTALIRTLGDIAAQRAAAQS